MKQTHHLLLIAISLLEVICTVYLTGLIIQKKMHQTVSVSPIEKKNIQFPSDTRLTAYYEQKPNTFVEEPQYWLQTPAVHSINADGLNERYDYTQQKDPGTFRIITIGDSFTEGMYVDTKDNYSERLEDMLNATIHCRNIKQIEVINLGVEGFDMQYILERYKRKGMKYDPDLVIFTTTGTNFVFSNERQHAAPHERLTGLQKTTLMQEQLGYLWEFSRIFGNTFIIFTTPLDWMLPQISQTMRLIQATRPETSVIPLLTAFDSFPDKHPSVTGHLQIAGMLYAQLVNNHFIPCR